MPDINLNVTHTHNINLNSSSSPLNTSDFMRGDELIRSFEDSIEKFSANLTKNNPTKQLLSGDIPKDKATQSLNNEVIKKLGRSYLDNPQATQKYLTQHNELINTYKKGIITQTELNNNLKQLNENIGRSSGGGVNNKIKDSLKFAVGASVLGAMVAFGNTFAERGAILGKQSESLNTSPFQAPSLAQNYATQLIQNSTKQKTIATGGVSSLIGGLLGSLILPGAGTVLGMGTGYILSSLFSGKYNRDANTEIGLNQFKLAQDTNAFQLRNMLNLPTSNFGNVNVGGNNYPTQISSIQESMLNNPQLSPYVSLIPSMLLNANRRFNFKDIPTSAQNIFNSARLMGIDNNNIPNFVNSATTLASASGKPLNQVLTEMVSDNKNYGGNIMKNTAEMVNLLQTTKMGYDQARDLVNRYQYNQPALKNIVGLQTSTPLNIAISRALMGILPNATKDEIQSLTLSPQHLSTYRELQRSATLQSKKLPETILMDMIYGRTNQNLNITDFGVMSKKTGSINLSDVNSQSTSAIKIMSDMLKATLANVNINNQTVKATNVYIEGKDKDNFLFGSPATSWDTPVAPNHSSAGSNSDIMVPPLVKR